MKTLKARFRLIDCGAASRRTRGMLSSFFSEAGTPPFIYWNL